MGIDPVTQGFDDDLPSLMRDVVGCRDDLRRAEMEVEVADKALKEALRDRYKDEPTRNSVKQIVIEDCRPRPVGSKKQYFIVRYLVATEEYTIQLAD